jgi:hypothetical protein
MRLCDNQKAKPSRGEGRKRTGDRGPTEPRLPLKRGAGASRARRRPTTEQRRAELQLCPPWLWCPRTTHTKLRLVHNCSSARSSAPDLIFFLKVRSRAGTSPTPCWWPSASASCTSAQCPGELPQPPGAASCQLPAASCQEQRVAGRLAGRLKSEVWSLELKSTAKASSKHFQKNQVNQGPRGPACLQTRPREVTSAKAGRPFPARHQGL